MNDRWAAARRALVDDLRARGIRDERVLGAIGRVRREEFADHDPASYWDMALPIGSGQTISQPFMVAAMTQALEVTPEARVLDVGTGSGYQAAVLAELCREVWGVERLPNLAETAAWRLAGLGYATVQVITGDGTLGLPEQAPFDRILGAAALPAIPPPWIEQLAEGGTIVAPVGDRWQQMLTIARKEGGRLRERRELPCVFVPMIGRYGFPDGA